MVMMLRTGNRNKNNKARSVPTRREKGRGQGEKLTVRVRLVQPPVLHALRDRSELLGEVGRDLVVVEMVVQEVELGRDALELLRDLGLKERVKTESVSQPLVLKEPLNETRYTRGTHVRRRQRLDVIKQELDLLEDCDVLSRDVAPVSRGVSRRRGRSGGCCRGRGWSRLLLRRRRPDASGSYWTSSSRWRRVRARGRRRESGRLSGRRRVH